MSIAKLGKIPGWRIRYCVFHGGEIVGRKSEIQTMTISSDLRI